LPGGADPCWRKPGFVSCDIFLRFSACCDAARGGGLAAVAAAIDPNSSCRSLFCASRSGRVRVRRVASCGLACVCAEERWLDSSCAKASVGCACARRQVGWTRREARAYGAAGAGRRGGVGRADGEDGQGKRLLGTNTGALRLPPLLLLSYPAETAQKDSRTAFRPACRYTAL